VIITCNNGRIRLEPPINGDLTDPDSARLRVGLTLSLLNAVDGTVYYAPLTEDASLSIVRKELDELAARCRELHNVQVSWSTKVLPFLASARGAPRSGARVLMRIVREYVKEPLAWQLGQHDWVEGDKIRAKVDQQAKTIVFAKSFTPRP